jgi:hypothetical protein
MDANEKAKELVFKFLQYIPAKYEFEFPYAKQCALIAVDEIIESRPQNPMMVIGKSYLTK